MALVKIKFYLKKIQRASTAEIVFRISEFLWQKIERFLYRDLALNRFDDEAKIIRKIKRENKQAHVNFFPPFEDNDKTQDFISTYYPEWFNKAIEDAEKILTGKIHRLGIDFDLSGTINWHQDPVTKKEYSLNYYRDVRIFGGDYGLGDIKHIWEVNRHQYLIDLAKAYFLTGEEKYFRRIIALISDWVESNPYNFGVNWTSGLEVAVRALAWIWVYFFIKHSPLFTEKEEYLFLVNIFKHGKYLQKHLSLYFSPYNHLVGESTVLYLIGLLFPELPASAKRKKTGWKVFSKIISNQFYKDGFTREQASFYHHFTLGFYLQVYLLAKQNDQKAYVKLENYLKRAIKASQSLTAPNGKVPQMGDCDDAQSIYLKYDISWNFSFFHQLGFVLFGLEQYGVKADLSEEVFWLTGQRGAEKYLAIEQFPELPAVENLEDSGYLIIRRKHDKKTLDYLLFDYGEICDGLYPDGTVSAGHGHADLLQFEFHPFGIPWLVDRGYYTYNGPLEWHKEFRSAASHNTIMIDDESMLQHPKRLSWAYCPEPLGGRIFTDENLTVLSGKYSGFKHLGSPVTHERMMIQLRQGLLIIFDRLLGDGKHTIRQNFNFHPHIEVSLDNTNGFKSSFKEKYFLSGFTVTKPKTITLRKGKKKYPDSWFAPGYNQLVPAWHLEYCFETEFPTVLCGFMAPASQGSDNQIRIKKHQISSNYAMLDFDLNEENITLFVNLSGQKISFPDSKNQSDTLLIYESRDGNGRLRDSSRLKWTKEILDS